jgi:hypothetical protein
MDHGLDHRWGMVGQDISSSPSGHCRVIEASGLGLLATNVVEQCGRSHDAKISILRSPDALCELQHAANVVEVVDGVCAVVEAPCFGD